MEPLPHDFTEQGAARWSLRQAVAQDNARQPRRLRGLCTVSGWAEMMGTQCVRA